MDNIASLKNQLEEKDLLLRKRDDEERELRSVFQQTMVEKDRELERAFEKSNELNLRMKEIEAKIQARNCELEKNLANETQRNISLQKEILMLKDRVQLQQLALLHKESQLVLATEALYIERAKIEITGAELESMKNWVTELGGENALIKEDLEDKCLDITLLRKELGDELEKTQVLKEEVQVMKNWVSELGAENSKLKEGLEEALLEVTTLKDSLVNEKREALHCRDQQTENFANAERKLICEKQDLEDKLDVALRRGKELERERSEMRVHYQERLKEEDNEKEKLREWEEQLQDNLESALHQQQNLEHSLKHAEGEICSLKKAESINLCELEQLRKECERLKDKCRMQEENTIKERKRVREYLRTQEEELRNQDRYMLMALLHGTAQRNFHLEHIALDRRNKSLDNNSEEVEPHSSAETTEGRKDQCQVEDLLDQLWKLEEEQYRKYRNAQREKDDYGKQWEDLTQMVEDLIQGDERKDC
ncbi:hyaluronan mediated motility receptor-like [Macrobrachium rosenbergii]|uniref:hyaluronan mediated motility receptor-like n=1 Tax=Macrobrachium rosenbergii TaxID=79674 RepID=UPI0034D6CECA